MKDSIKEFVSKVEKMNPNEPEFMQAITEVAEVIIPFIEENKEYQGKKLLERMAEPERTIMFRVSWTDDRGEIQVNRGYRVEFNSAIGPYKGGLRFHPSVNLSILKFLGFEQVFKNSLTTLPMGGGKGGSDFIGPNTDVPAGDIGVGGREIGFLFGQYKRLRNEFTGVLTGKGLSYGGSLIRPEATGYGNVYFAKNMLATRGDSFEGKTVTISGSGNVAQYAAEKVIQFGGTVLTLSDSGGYIYDADGINTEKLAFVMELKNVKRARISEYVSKYPSAKYVADERPWNIKCDIALPCATQNEVNKKEAQVLIDNGCFCVGEGANMPCTSEAIELFTANKLLFSPGKASNAGGVATSGLEMSQNSLRLSWTAKEVDDKLHTIMNDIHDACVTYGKDESGYIDYVKGANIAGFVKLADAMMAQGVV